MDKFKLKRKFIFLASLTILLILIQIINLLSSSALLQWGILPRTESGLLGILVAPFIHASWSHLFSNLVPLLVLSFLLMTQSLRQYIQASLFIIIISGLLVWIFGRAAIHIGASGWIFGLWALLIAHAFTRHTIIDIIVALLVLFYYGSIAYGLIPGQLGISTEYHITGVVAGLFYAWCARALRRRKSKLTAISK